MQRNKSKTGQRINLDTMLGALPHMSHRELTTLAGAINGQLLDNLKVFMHDVMGLAEAQARYQIILQERISTLITVLSMKGDPDGAITYLARPVSYMQGEVQLDDQADALEYYLTSYREIWGMYIERLGAQQDRGLVGVTIERIRAYEEFMIPVIAEIRNVLAKQNELDSKRQSGEKRQYADVTQLRELLSKGVSKNMLEWVGYQHQKKASGRKAGSVDPVTERLRSILIEVRQDDSPEWKNTLAAVRARLTQAKDADPIAKQCLDSLDNATMPAQIERLQTIYKRVKDQQKRFLSASVE